MQFKGHLLLPDETGPGLRVNLDVAEHHLAVESDGGGLGAWPLEAVGVERRGDVFDLTVAGEALRFLADDTIGFAYTAVPNIERVSGRRPRARSSLRSFVDRLWNGPEDSKPSGPSAPEIVAGSEPVAEPREVLSVPETPDVDSLRPGLDPAEEAGFQGDEHVAMPKIDFVELVESEQITATCPAIRSDGRRCESSILTESGYCYPHDPKRAFSDKYKAAQEAKSQLRRDATARLNRVYSRLDKAMRQVERGELDPETAMAMAQLARTMCAILDVDETGSGSR